MWQCMTRSQVTDWSALTRRAARTTSINVSAEERRSARLDSARPDPTRPDRSRHDSRLDRHVSIRWEQMIRRDRERPPRRISVDLTRRLWLGRASAAGRVRSALSRHGDLTRQPEPNNTGSDRREVQGINPDQAAAAGREGRKSRWAGPGLVGV